jgi:hypothetical protein
VTLLPNPCSRIVVPVMAFVRQLAERCLNVIPASLVVESTSDQLGDKAASTPWPYSTIQLSHELMIERYVQTHVLKIAHTQNPSRWVAISAIIRRRYAMMTLNVARIRPAW